MTMYDLCCTDGPGLSISKEIGGSIYWKHSLRLLKLYRNISSQNCNIKLSSSGAVTGLLKVGTKNLYVFDPNGETKQVSAPCVLDFYVHESRQRSGLGKKLFQTMLDSEGINPSKLAIDRPSEKLVGFLKKHYGKSNWTSLSILSIFIQFDHQQVLNEPYHKWIISLYTKDFSTQHNVNSHKWTIED